MGFFLLKLIHNLHFTTNLFKLTILDNHLTRHYVTDKKLQDVLPTKNILIILYAFCPALIAQNCLIEFAIPMS